MNLFRKLYCRIYQGVFRLLLPVLPYRKPTLLADYGQLVATLAAHKKSSVLVVTDKGICNLGLTNALETELTQGGFKVTVYSGTDANPTTSNVEEALQAYYANSCDCIVAFGGGSPMDCAKAVGARVACPKKSLSAMKGLLKVGRKIPLLVAIPTTAGTGSETTLAAVITDSQTRHKYAINDFNLIPRFALLDERLTLNLPPHITAATGMDALTHAVEAYIGRSTTKETRQVALQAVKLIFDNLPVAYSDGHNLSARKNMLNASYLAGLAFTKSYVGYVHAVAHSLGGKYNVQHGVVNAIILPRVLKVYGKSIYKKLWKLGVYAGLFSADTSVETGAKLFIDKIEQMNAAMGIGTAIDQIEIDDIADLAKTAAYEANPLYPVPVLLDAKQLEQIYYSLIEPNTSKSID